MMSATNKVRRWAGAGAALTALLVLAWAVLAPSRAPVQPAAPAHDAELVGSLDRYRLLDQNGRSVALSSLRGRTVLMHFVFTGCSSVCPPTMVELLEIQRALPAAYRDRVQFVSVSVDPLNDTPAALLAWGQRLGLDFGNWSLLTGERVDIDHLTRQFAAFDPRVESPTPGDHTNSLILLDAHGRVMQRYQGVQIDRARVQRELLQLDDLVGPSARRA